MAIHHQHSGFKIREPQDVSGVCSILITQTKLPCFQWIRGKSNGMLFVTLWMIWLFHVYAIKLFEVESLIILFLNVSSFELLVFVKPNYYCIMLIWSALLKKCKCYFELGWWSIDEECYEIKMWYHVYLIKENTWWTIWD